MRRAPLDARAALRVLIIEDNLSIAAVVGEAFEDAGHSIVGHAKSVEQSLELISAGNFDLALLDVHLKERHSGPAAAELRKRNIPFVVMTGSTHMMTPAHCGCADYPQAFQDR